MTTSGAARRMRTRLASGLAIKLRTTAGPWLTPTRTAEPQVAAHPFLDPQA